MKTLRILALAALWGLASTVPAADVAAPKDVPPAATTVMIGEQINWQVVSGGGSRAASTEYTMDATVGQTAVGDVASALYKIKQGFWQNWPATSCCVGYTGNVNMSGIVDLSDLSALVSYLTGGGYVLPCPAEANVNNTGIVDLSDLSALVSYLTGGGYVLPCPQEANVNAVGIVDLSDLSALVSYLTGGGYVLPLCP